MALSNETKAWLDDLKAHGGLTDEAFNSLKASVESNDKADNFIKGSALRQADYSRAMGEIQTAQKAVETAANELAAREQKVTQFQTELGTWKASKEQMYVDAVKAAETSATKLAAATNRLKSVAQAYNLDETDVLKDLDVANTIQTPNPQAPAGIDTSKFLTKEQLSAQIKAAEQEIGRVDAAIYDIATEHQRLFGKALPGAKALVDGAIKAGVTLEDYWRTTYKVAEKEAEVTEKAIQERINKAVEESNTRRASEDALRLTQPGMAPQGGANSPVFKNENAMKPLAADHQSGGGISAAVASFLAGKHRQ